MCEQVDWLTDWAREERVKLGSIAGHEATAEMSVFHPIPDICRMSAFDPKRMFGRTGRGAAIGMSH